MLGGGNNLLVSDRGFRGVVLKLEGCLGRAEFHGEEAVAGAGVSLSALIREAAALNLGGIECLVGIPATIGGAVAMNAGTPDGWHRRLRLRRLLPPSRRHHGRVQAGRRLASATACSRAPPGAVLIGARLQSAPAALPPRSRRTSSSGSSRRSPPSRWRWPRRVACGRTRPARRRRRLIEKVGLKGKRLNGAEISAKHANFIVNRGGATAADIKALMDITRERVQNHFGIALEPEIKTLGRDLHGMRRSTCCLRAPRPAPSRTWPHAAG